MTTSKTGRIRGLIYRAVRAAALKRKTISADDLSPSLGRPRAQTVLTRLYQLGELEVIKPARLGRHGRGRVFRATPILRAPEWTNLHSETLRLRVSNHNNE